MNSPEAYEHLAEALRRTPVRRVADALELYAWLVKTPIDVDEPHQQMSFSVFRSLADERLVHASFARDTFWGGVDIEAIGFELLLNGVDGLPEDACELHGVAGGCPPLMEGALSSAAFLEAVSAALAELRLLDHSVGETRLL